MTDEERLDWLSEDIHRLNYVQEYKRIAENDIDLRGAIDALSSWSQKELRETFTHHEDRFR